MKQRSPNLKDARILAKEYEQAHTNLDALKSIQEGHKEKEEQKEARKKRKKKQ
jgi:hypothetical protein